MKHMPFSDSNQPRDSLFWGGGEGIYKCNPDHNMTIRGDVQGWHWTVINSAWGDFFPEWG
jgi:hypothetical protein